MKNDHTNGTNGHTKVIMLDEEVVLFFPGPNYDRIENGTAYLRVTLKDAIMIDEDNSLTVVPRSIVYDAIPDSDQVELSDNDWKKILDMLREDNLDGENG